MIFPVDIIVTEDKEPLAMMYGRWGHLDEDWTLLDTDCPRAFWCYDCEKKFEEVFGQWCEARPDETLPDYFWSNTGEG